MNDTKPFAASKGWLHRFRNTFRLKHIKITGEASSADEVTDCCHVSCRVEVN